MAEDVINRVSALAGTYRPGLYGMAPATTPGLRFTEVPLHRLTQFCAWHDTRAEFLTAVCRLAGATDSLPHAGSITGSLGSVLQLEPLKWWLLDAVPEDMHMDLGAALDLSHARTRLRIEGHYAAELLNRHLALDLRDAVASDGKVQSCSLHQAPVTVWHTGSGFELFVSRAYASSVFALLQKSAAQFGYEICQEGQVQGKADEHLPGKQGPEN